MRTKYNKRRFRTLIMIVVILLCMSIGYSYLLTTLNIEGTSNIKANTWDVHWENVNVKSGSVTGDQVPIAAHIMSNTTQAEYSVILKNPGEYYEFSVDAKNAGSIDAMVDIINTTFYESNGVTQITQPSYLEYSFTYEDGLPVSSDQILEAGQKETLKVKIKFIDDLEESELPTTDKTIVIRQSITYVQADDNAVSVLHPVSFAEDDWATIIHAVELDATSNYNVGDTKEVDMGSLGTHTLRIANKSTPSECNNSNFSETACGFVLEFVDIIKDREVNYPGVTNVGGWPSSDLKNYLITNIYNEMPEILRDAILDTKVISGHGSTSGEGNFISTEMIYLLSTHEVWKDVDGNATDGIDYYDTAYNNTRQLDYYSSQNVTTSNYSAAIKKDDGSNTRWWLRSAYANNNYSFYCVWTDGSIGFSSSNANWGISPAFRIGPSSLL